MSSHCFWGRLRYQRNIHPEIVWVANVTVNRTISNGEKITHIFQGINLHKLISLKLSIKKPNANGI